MTDHDPNPSSFNDPADEYLPTKDERNLAVIAHLSGCAGFLGFGLLGFVGPLIIYLLQKDSSPYIEGQAKEALNFQITMFGLSVIAGLLALVSCGTLAILILVPIILQLVYSIIAALSVKDGNRYRYPICIRLLQ